MFKVNNQFSLEFINSSTHTRAVPATMLMALFKVRHSNEHLVFGNCLNLVPTLYPLCRLLSFDPFFLRLPLTGQRPGSLNGKSKDLSE